MQNKIASLTTVEKYFYQIIIITFLHFSFAMLITCVFEFERLKSKNCKTLRRQSKHGNFCEENFLMYKKNDKNVTNKKIG